VVEIASLAVNVIGLLTQAIGTGGEYIGRHRVEISRAILPNVHKASSVAPLLAHKIIDT
jgi:hypothetical protein